MVVLLYDDKWVFDYLLCLLTYQFVRLVKFITFLILLSFFGLLKTRGKNVQLAFFFFLNLKRNCEWFKNRSEAEHENISYNTTRMRVFALKTSSTWGCEGIQNSVSWELMEKRKVHKGGKDSGRKLLGKAYLPPTH